MYNHPPEGDKTTTKMSEIKLQVGKTYRSREGEEVKIVKKDNKGWDYWVGSNGEWYYEGGKWSRVAEKHPKDLNEEVPEPRSTFGFVPGALTTTRYTFVKEVTVKQIGNRIVVETVPEKGPNPGGVSGSLTPFGESIKLLRDLADLQNGAPLEQYRKEWEETIAQVYDFLDKWEGQ